MSIADSIHKKAVLEFKTIIFMNFAKIPEPDAWKVSISFDCSVFELTISLAWSTRAQKHLMIHQKSSTDFPTMSSQFSFIPFLYEIVGDSNNSTACKKKGIVNPYTIQILYHINDITFDITFDSIL